MIELSRSKNRKGEDEMRNRSRFIAGALAVVMTISALPLTDIKAAESENFADAKELSLSFEDALTDASSNQIAVSASKDVSYVAGVNGSKAINFDGSTYLDLGTDAALSPESLTVSFWIKPNGTMTGEQLLTWNKNEWYTDGWYLASENDSTPLALSVGPAATNKQPYKLAVTGTRSKFFPADTWTHIVVTYDNTTKQAAVYRNGIAQTVTTVYGTSDTSTGVIGPCADTKKTMGYNGPVYKSSYLKAAIDEYELYSTVCDQKTAIDLYEAGGATFDKKAVAQEDLDAVEVVSTTARSITLPTTGKNGSVITWKSSNASVLADDGTVTSPEADTVVELTATASFLDGEAVQKKFNVTVTATTTAVTDKITDISMKDVTLEDAYLVNAAQKENDYLLSLSADKFLYYFYNTAGLTPTASESYGGWERGSGNNFRGHMFGHYMSALSQAYMGTADATEKAELLKEIKTAVNGLKECQDAYAVKYPDSAGYIAPFGEGNVLSVAGLSTNGRPTSANVIVPWYNLHKVLAGLIDVYTFVGDDAIADTALDVAEGFGEYIYNYGQKLTDTSKLLSIEYGGMNEALYELYDLTGNDKIKAAAHYFDEDSLFNNLAANKDVLNGKHANTTIPKFIGALKRYTVMTNNEEYYDALTSTEQEDLEKYLTAAENFWDIVINHHTYITGGNSQSEHFHAADSMYHYAEGVDDYAGSITCETCNIYNMLKLSRALYQVTKDKKYMDYYENTYINAILSSQNPETGTTMYFQPMAPGYNKVFNRPYDEFWCCTGTGVENFSKLGDTFYFVEKENVYVNLYFSNTYDYARQNLKLDMDANMPNSDEVTVTVSALDGTAVKEGTNLRFRIPDWVAGEAEILVNGKKQTITEAEDADGYAVVAGVKAGDVIKLKFPMEVKAYATQDNDNFIAFKYGPVVLSAGLGTNDIEASNKNGVLVRVGTRDASCQTAVIVDTDTVEEWVADVKDNLVRIEDSADGQVQFKLKNTDSDDLVYTPHFMRYKERYGLYMTFEVKDSEAAQERIKQNKEILREEEVSVDNLTSFDDNNSEAAKNKQGENTSTGSYNGRTYRHAEKADGWFSYDLQVNPKADKQYLVCTYTTADNGRSFDIYVGDTKLTSVTINNTAGSNVFYEEAYEIPKSLWENAQAKKDLTTGEKILDDNGNEIPAITVKFASNGNSVVGGLYGVAIKSSMDYATDADLTALSFDKGTLTPAFDTDTKEYTLTVPKATDSVNMNVSPNVGSGLVYVNDILIDDTEARTIPLSNDTTTVRLTAYAQDHTTNTTYTVTIAKTDETVSNEDIEAANAVTKQINAIGKVTYTDECKAKIDAARAAYNALSDVQKSLTGNLEILEKAEYAYQKLTPQKLADFTFDDEESGFAGGMAKGTNAGAVVLSDEAKSGKALSLDGTGTNYVTVTDENGDALLSGLDAVTISYWSKVNNTNANWAFFAAPDETAPTYKKEVYLGLLDEGASFTVQRFNNTTARPTSAKATITQNEWKYITVVCDADKTSIYVNGELKAEQASDYALSDIFGENGILYLGKATWGSGEYFNGLIDELSIYNYALTKDAVVKAYEESTDQDKKDQNAADAVIAKINALGEITSLDSKTAVEEARKAYDALTDAQKELVTNKNVLEAAEAKIKTLEAQDADQKAANAVVAKINALGEVTSLDSKTAVEEARAAYDALTDAQKELVTNKNVLETAEAKIKALEEAGNQNNNGDNNSGGNNGNNDNNNSNNGGNNGGSNNNTQPSTDGNTGNTGNTQTPTAPTAESIVADNPALPSGTAEDSKSAVFGELKAKVKTSKATSNKIQWSKVKDADGYVVFGNKCNSKGKKYAFEVLSIIDNNNTTSYTHTGLAKATYYKYLVQAYKMVDGKAQIISTSKTIHAATKSAKYANVSKLKLNKTNVTLQKKGKNFKVTAKVIKTTGKKLVNHRKVCFESSNPKVATVNSKGVIKAKKKGTCTIYVYAQNGVCQTVKVKVKK